MNLLQTQLVVTSLTLATGVALAGAAIAELPTNFNSTHRPNHPRVPTLISKF